MYCAFSVFHSWQVKINHVTKVNERVEIESKKKSQRLETAENIIKKANHKIVSYLSKQIFILKGKFPKTTMWIGWVESNFTNTTVKVWADLDNPFKRSDYAKLCMSPSLDGTLPEYVILYKPLFSHTVIFAFLDFCGNSRVVNFAIFLMLSLL